VLAVCPTGWGSPTDTINRQARLAVQTGVFPLYEVENGVYRMTVETPQLRPITDYTSVQRRFRHLSEDILAKIQKRVELEYQKLLEKTKHGSKKV
jgi:pyruvate ferredoxin oxidoreductase beta subunit